jgi:hypothetical protein
MEGDLASAKGDTGVPPPAAAVGAEAVRLSGGEAGSVGRRRRGDGEQLPIWGLLGACGEGFEETAAGVRRGVRERGGACA